MKTNIIITLSAITLGIFIGIYFPKANKPAQASQLKLEEILSIKELHLVKHHYHDLFFLHRKNNASKSIRAIVQVPVTIVSYLDLKKIQLVRQHDSITQVILPRALVHPPSYELNKMTIRKTRSFQVHAGKDLYPEVSRYLAASLSLRMDSIHHIAIENKILEQAEAEGKEYIEGILRSIGRSDIKVTFGDESKDNQIKFYQRSNQAKTIYFTQWKY